MNDPTTIPPPAALVTLRPTDPDRGDPLRCGSRGCPRDATVTAEITEDDPAESWGLTACPDHVEGLWRVATSHTMPTEDHR